MRNRFIESQQRDAAIAVAFLHLGYDISGLPLWDRDNETGETYLSVNGSIVLAETFGIETAIVRVKRETVNIDTFPKSVYHAVVKAELDGRVRLGASTSQDEDVAVLLARRNAIRQVLPGQDKAKWFYTNDERYGDFRDDSIAHQIQSEDESDIGRAR